MLDTCRRAVYSSSLSPVCPFNVEKWEVERGEGAGMDIDAWCWTGFWQRKCDIDSKALLPSSVPRHDQGFLYNPSTKHMDNFTHTAAIPIVNPSPF
jgi:hypothetical protein